MVRSSLGCNDACSAGLAETFGIPLEGDCFLMRCCSHCPRSGCLLRDLGPPNVSWWHCRRWCDGGHSWSWRLGWGCHRSGRWSSHIHIGCLQLELLEVNVCPPTITNAVCKRKPLSPPFRRDWSTLILNHLTPCWCAPQIIFASLNQQSYVVGWSILVTRWCCFAQSSACLLSTTTRKQKETKGQR